MNVTDRLKIGGQILLAKASGRPRPFFVQHGVLSVHSGRTLPWLLDFVARESLPLTINVMRSEESGLWHDAVAHRESREQIQHLLDMIIESKKRNPSIVFSSDSYRLTRHWPDFTRDRLTAAETGGHFQGPRCHAGRFHCAIYADGHLYPCALTLKQVPALNVKTAGVAAALERARNHGCATPCMLEQNALFSLNPRVVGSLARTYLRTRLE